MRAKAAKKIEKAYLYRSILAETSHRQVEQAEGTGRLDPKKMRDFLRELAWEMHSRSVDSMDPFEVMPILKRFYPNENEQDLAELAEVAVVNSPELTKGEETGFEFVHKSFAEFLVGERFADLVEKVAFKAPEYGSDELTWRMASKMDFRILRRCLVYDSFPTRCRKCSSPCLDVLFRFQKVKELMMSWLRRLGAKASIESLRDLNFFLVTFFAEDRLKLLQK